MKVIKGLILGSAASLLAMSTAQAADLPLKAKAVEYVRICSLYGAGFYYIPGTDTCIKLGGYLRVETALNTNSVYTMGAVNSVGGARNRDSNYFTARSRQALNIDTRTATEYGVVRTFFDATFSWTSGSYSGSTPTAYTGAAPVGNPSDGGIAGGSLGVYYAFIQFAGFTMGKAVSQFDTPWVSYPGNNFDGLVGGGGTITGVNQFTYTAQFGNGVSAAISAQDATAYNQTNIWNTAGAAPAGILTGAYGTQSLGGTRSPDIIGMLRVDQAWGVFQASAALHNNHTSYYGASETTGGPGDKWGWAGQVGLSLKNIPTGPGDTINVQAVYTNGASRYNFQSLVPTTFAMYGGTNLPGAYQGLTIAGVSDSIYGAGTAQELTSTWGFRGAFNHNWDAHWSSSLYGAYASVMYNGNAKALICAPVLANMVAGSTCNPDFNIGQLGLVTRWTPVKGLTFSGDVTYNHIDQKFAGAFVAPAQAAVAKPAANYEARDQGTVSMLLRAQRNW